MTLDEAEVLHAEHHPGYIVPSLDSCPEHTRADYEALAGSSGQDVAAHTQVTAHRYLMHFPEHPARADDPHYVDFNHYHRLHRPTARCYIGQRIGYGDCMDAQTQPCPPPASGGEQAGLELHHAHVEFSLQNGVSLAALEVDYPGISDPAQIGAWVESDQNFRWYCAWHHRGVAGAHSASHSDFEASAYVQGLITKAS